MYLEVHLNKTIGDILVIRFQKKISEAEQVVFCAVDKVVRPRDFYYMTNKH